jgi:cystathionine beta-lyase
MAPSKTFNIAGLSSSVCYCPNESLRRRFFGYLDGYEIANGNIFAYVGAEAAFRQGEDWLRQMLQYVQRNVGFMNQFLSERMPYVKAVLPEASYLPWLDFNGLGLSHDELKDRLINRAKVALNDGTTFGGKAYQGCFRLNIGTPRAVLQEALERISAAME